MPTDIIGTLEHKAQLTYDDMGEGGIPLIFIHGFPFDKSMWQPQMEYFKSTHRVIAYDIRGFGKSFDDANDLSMSLFADDLIKLMDLLHISKATICGLSMGGYIALNAVNRYSERIAALILCDTQCISDSEEIRKKRYSTIEQIRKDGREDFTADFISKIFHKDSFINYPDKVELVKEIIRANSQHTILRGLAAIAERVETCSTLGLISVPTLIICGSNDAITPPEKSEYLHKHIKNSTLQIVESAGHVSNLEQPEVFNQYLMDFLRPVG